MYYFGCCFSFKIFVSFSPSENNGSKTYLTREKVDQLSLKSLSLGKRLLVTHRDT